jgi:hypothetical protein
VIPEDAESAESPLIMSVARQLVAGPSGLYGPFGGENPLVLIHAPLYYRLAALLAWPLFRAGWDPVMAALVAGRTLSAISLLATLGLAARLARLGGIPARAGGWAALLVAAAPILGGISSSVRPDQLGVALQTAGLLLVLESLRDDRPGTARLLGASAAFGLAICVKQHDMGVALVSTGLLLAACRRGRIGLPKLGGILLVAPTIALIIYCTEERVTGGRMSQAVFRAAAYVGQVHPADWRHARVVVISAFGKSLGLAAALAAAWLIIIGARAGIVRRGFATVAAVLVTTLVGLMSAQLAMVAIGTIREPSETLVNLFAGVGRLTLQLAMVTTAGILPFCLLVDRGRLSGGGVDAALWACVLMDCAIMAALSRISTGAWSNYAVEAVVLLSVLAARAMARACEEVRQGWLLVPGAVAVLIAAVLQVGEEESIRGADRRAVAEVIRRVERPRSAFFFDDHPGVNCLDGRLDLVYDDWLYPVFESIGLAEPRAAWLTRALTSGPVQVVVTTSDRPRVGGNGPPLTRLRYRPTTQVGPFFVWVR